MQGVRACYPASAHDFELDSLAMEAHGRAQRAPDYVGSYVRRGEYGYRLSQFLARHDVYMTPTLAAPPPRIGQLTTPRWAAALLRVAMRCGLARLLPLARSTIEQVTIDHLRGAPFTQLANVTGVPGS
jgi:amidase